MHNDFVGKETSGIGRDGSEEGRRESNKEATGSIFFVNSLCNLTNTLMFCVLCYCFFGWKEGLGIV